MHKNKLTKLFKNIKLLILDVDGVLTKGEIIYDDKGRDLKIFNVKDGLGIYLLGRAGIPTIFLTAKTSPVVLRRAKDMGVVKVIGGILPKERSLSGILKSCHVKPQEICFIGDDLIDIGFMKEVGLAVAVADAPQAVRKHAAYVTAKNGGEGAVREIVDLILNTQNLEQKVYHLLQNP
jgi:3-deoxy-D-manno-octulosonate 8-phosphate phosphatase (KDO 8-P phosphatase)